MKPPASILIAADDPRHLRVEASARALGFGPMVITVAPATGRGSKTWRKGTFVARGIADPLDRYSSASALTLHGEGTTADLAVTALVADADERLREAARVWRNRAINARAEAERCDAHAAELDRALAALPALSPEGGAS